MGSLLEGIETTPAKTTATSKGSSSRDSARTIKLTLAVVGLLIGGALIAWNLGVFGSGATPPATAEGAVPLAPSSPTPQVRKVDPPRNLDAPQVRQPANELIEQRSR